MKLNPLFSYAIKKTSSIILLAMSLNSVCLSHDNYFICGPDEGGCTEDLYQYCNCIPADETEMNKPFCFDFDNLTCSPLSKKNDCEPDFIFNNQNECLSTIFHSMPIATCTKTTLKFCTEHHTRMCDPSGQPNSCH